jgi:hypothetical protein
MIKVLPYIFQLLEEHHEELIGNLRNIIENMMGTQGFKKKKSILIHTPPSL